MHIVEIVSGKVGYSHGKGVTFVLGKIPIKKIYFESEIINGFYSVTKILTKKNVWIPINQHSAEIKNDGLYKGIHKNSLRHKLFNYDFVLQMIQVCRSLPKTCLL